MIALIGSLLTLAGAKAQTTPVIKKETVKPVAIKPASKDTGIVVHKITKVGQNDSVTIKKAFKEIKIGKTVPTKGQPTTKPMKY